MEQPGINPGERIDELEARLAQQDDSILQLSDEIYWQQRQIAQLESKMRELTERVQLLAPAQGASSSADEPPPHY